MKNFTYKRMEFEGYRELSPIEQDLKKLNDRLRDIHITPHNWSIDEFFQKASENNCDKIHLFKTDLFGIPLIVFPTKKCLCVYEEE